MPLTPKEFSTIALDIADIVPIAKSSDKSLLETITFKATVLVLFPVIESAFITPDEISTSILISELAVAFNSPDKLIVSIFPFCKSTVELANNKSLALTVESLSTFNVEFDKSKVSFTVNCALSKDTCTPEILSDSNSVVSNDVPLKISLLDTNVSPDTVSELVIFETVLSEFTVIVLFEVNKTSE